jgi:hypothetical protein
MLRVVARHPFVLIAGLGLLAFGALVLIHPPLDSLGGRLTIGLLRTAGAGFYFAANLLARHLPNIPGWLDVSLIIILGSLPYAAADAVLRRIGVAVSRGQSPESASRRP